MSLSERGREQAVRIINTIQAVRAEFNACTNREIARRLRVDQALMQRQMIDLRERGLVDWKVIPKTSTSFPGSLIATKAGIEFAAALPVAPTPAPVVTTSVKPKGVTKKKPAKKKAKKKAAPKSKTLADLI